MHKKELLAMYGAPERGTRAQIMASIQQTYVNVLTAYDKIMAKPAGWQQALAAMGTVWEKRFGGKYVPAYCSPACSVIAQKARAGLINTGTGREQRADMADATYGQPRRTRTYTAYCKKWGHYGPARLARYNIIVYRNRLHYRYINADGKTIHKSHRIVRGRVAIGKKLYSVWGDAQISAVSAKTVLQACRRRHICDWGEDSSGVYIKIGQETYHIGCNSIPTALAWLRHRIRENKKIERNRRIDTALNCRGWEVMVSMPDSITAGNCPAGTERFVHSITETYFQGAPVTCLPADTLLAICNDDYTRRAARVAAIRQLAIA